jgi:acyl-CoA reductase-like NAD-dependent aldehyde dehydrogenase
MKRKAARLYVDGQWIDGDDLIDIRSPYDHALVGRHHRAGPNQVDRALAAAAVAFAEHKNDIPAERAAVLDAMAGILARRSEEFAQTICAEAGKPIRYARLEVERSLHTIRWSAEEAKRIGGEVIPLDVIAAGRGHIAITRRFPVGVILAITPFNFPLNLVAHKVGPGLAAGCSVVLRPASQTPLTSLLLAEVAEEAGLPAGLLNVVPCPVQLAETMIDDPRVAMVTFTGSPLVGWPLKKRAAHRKVTLELGGNAAVVFDSGVDPMPLLERLASAAYAYAGQSCISAQRILVPRESEAMFAEAFTAHVREKVPFGDPSNEETIAGPLIRSEEADRVMGWIGEARDSGAEILAGGHRSENLVEPTLLRKVDPRLRISCQEVFGPIAVIDTFTDFADAIRKVNDSDFGLQAGVFTHDIDHAFRAFRDVEVGGVLINEMPTWRIDHMPYGGVKQSGFGREGIRFAIEEMTEPKLLVLNLS